MFSLMHVIFAVFFCLKGISCLLDLSDFPKNTTRGRMSHCQFFGNFSVSIAGTDTLAVSDTLTIYKFVVY